jgi:hypothetical protein
MKEQLITDLILLLFSALHTESEAQATTCVAILETLFV